MGKIALYVALTEEMKYAVAEMGRFGKFNAATADPINEMLRGRTRFSFHFDDFPRPEDNIEVHLIGGMGNILTAAHVGTSFSENDSVRFAVLIGISGAMPGSGLGLGDVILGNSVKYYSPDKIYDIKKKKEEGKAKKIDKKTRELFLQKDADILKEFEERHDDCILYDERDETRSENVIRFLRDTIYHEDQSDYGYNFLRDIKRSSIPTEYKLSSGMFLGTNWVIDSESYANYIVDKDLYNCFDYYFINKKSEYDQRCKWHPDRVSAADMESYGFFKAIEMFSRKRANVKAYAVRGISDLCAGKSDLDITSNNSFRDAATTNCTNAAMRLLRYYLKEQRTSLDI